MPVKWKTAKKGFDLESFFWQFFLEENMYLMIDNYDSFVYNLVCYLQEYGEDVALVRNDKITIEKIKEFLNRGILKGIIISPGPKSPEDCGSCKEIVNEMAGKVPILGVCLGHQIIGHVFGATIKKGVQPMHGKVSRIFNNQRNLFLNLPKSYYVTRYHSLVISDDGFPDALEIDAQSEDGVIMGIHHKIYPIYGVQFHPEAVLTEYGHGLLKNFIKICNGWYNTYGNKNL